MLCTFIMSYTLLYTNGQTSDHRHLATVKDKAMIEKILKDPEFIKDFEVYQILKMKVKKIKGRPCT